MNTIYSIKQFRPQITCRNNWSRSWQEHKFFN